MNGNLGDQDLAGIIRLEAIRHVLVRPEMISELQKGVEDRLGSKAADFLYAAGSFWSNLECKRLGRNWEAKELFSRFCQHASELGWGVWKLESIQPTERGLVIRVERSFLAEAYGQSDQPVCHLVAGAISGLVESVFHLPATCTELSCKAQGASDCRFAAVANDVGATERWSW